VRVGTLLRLLFLPAVLASGCASAQKDTIMAELALAKSTSIGYRTVDGIDQLKTAKLHNEIASGQVVPARAEYAACVRRLRAGAMRTPRRARRLAVCCRR
jgi:hypothetical protein